MLFELFSVIILILNANAIKDYEPEIHEDVAQIAGRPCYKKRFQHAVPFIAPVPQPFPVQLPVRLLNKNRVNIVGASDTRHQVMLEREPEFIETEPFNPTVLPAEDKMPQLPVAPKFPAAPVIITITETVPVISVISSTTTCYETKTALLPASTIISTQYSTIISVKEQPIYEIVNVTNTETVISTSFLTAFETKVLQSTMTNLETVYQPEYVSVTVTVAPPKSTICDPIAKVEPITESYSYGYGI